MYSPQLGRFLNPDPLVANPTILYDNNWFGDRLTMMRNLYGYADNNPINRTDPSGLSSTGTLPESLVGLLPLPQPCGSVKYTADIGEPSLAKTEATKFLGCVGINPLTLFALNKLGVVPGVGKTTGGYSIDCVKPATCNCAKCTLSYKKTIKSVGPIDLRNYKATVKGPFGVEIKVLPRNCKIWIDVPVSFSVTVCVGVCQ